MRTTFAVGRADRRATEVRMVEEKRTSGGRRDGTPSFARSAGSSEPFPGPWKVKAVISGRTDSGTVRRIREG